MQPSPLAEAAELRGGWHHPPIYTARAMLSSVAHKRGDGGVVAIDRSGAVTLAFNSAGKKRAAAGSVRGPFVAVR